MPIQIDFQKYYPDQASLFKKTWPKLKSFIKTFADEKFRNKKNQTGTIKKLINVIKTSEGDHEDAAVLKILTYFLKITGLKATLSKSGSNKKRKFNQDSSDDESSEEAKTAPATYSPKDIEKSFIVHVDCAEKIDRELQRKINEALKKKITLQPYILIVGTPTVKLSSYVVVDDIKYATKSVIEALDLTFKIFFVSDSEYPTLSHHIWLFLQIAVYGIDEEKNVGTVIRNMIQSFKHHKV
ncbi:uncharacterized protein LOC141532092 [Cotesia typhae]|uniref:uncharacterized protein LOC141532092 n=1 Tax=Cotesia typhae TaxID=2053667 RepID=UPI003D685555